MNTNKSGFHGNKGNSSLALKTLVLMTTISLPNFMLVSKSAQFALKFELCRRTISFNALCF